MRLLVMAFVATVVVGDNDFHFAREDDMVMPGVRRAYRGDRIPRTPRPLMDSPILFPGASEGGEVPVDPINTRVSDPINTRVSDPINTHVSEPDGIIELPEDIEELDIFTLSRMNSITNITDFASLFNLVLPQSTPSIGDEGTGAGFSIGVRIGSTSQDGGESYEMANCKTELVTVPLDLPKEAGTLFFPTCIRLEQCGGCCYGPLLTCRPSVTKVVKVKVLKVSSSNSNSGGSTGRGRGGRGRRRRRQSQQSYHIVEAVKHTTCECGCKVRAEDCHSDLHSYREGECACICKNKDEQAKCEQQNTTKYWDNDTCNCFCRKEQQCSTGEIFSQVTCSCERLNARSGSFSPDVEVPSRRRRKPVRVPLF